MSDGISFFSNDDLNKHIKLVMSQTNYTEEEAIKKLKLYNCDYMCVLKDYMGISEKKDKSDVKSINQEIYKQIRTTLDGTMKEYREKNPVNIDQVITNLKESDQREKKKTNNIK